MEISYEQTNLLLYAFTILYRHVTHCTVLEGTNISVQIEVSTVPINEEV